MVKETARDLAKPTDSAMATVKAMRSARAMDSEREKVMSLVMAKDSQLRLKTSPKIRRSVKTVHCSSSFRRPADQWCHQL